MTPPTVLTVNCGSSSLKAALFCAQERRDFRYRQIGFGGLSDHRAAIDSLLREIEGVELAVIAHRITHGGELRAECKELDSTERQRLAALIDRAPLHLPHNLAAVDLCARYNTKQLACYDTGFHAHLAPECRRLPLPRDLGISRAGFHGLSFGHIAQQLARVAPQIAKGRVVIAHLGNGSSLCLLKDGQSVATTMGWSPLGGVPMATRCGDLDPAIIAHLAEELAPESLRDLLWRRCGLLALSAGRSSQMDELLADDSPDAQFAIGYFCQKVAEAIAGLATWCNGLDGLVFTGGIGENSPAVRSQIAARLTFLGIALNESSNRRNVQVIHLDGRLPTFRIPADEESRMCALADRHLGWTGQRAASHS